MPFFIMYVFTLQVILNIFIFAVRGYYFAYVKCLFIPLT